VKGVRVKSENRIIFYPQLQWVSLWGPVAAWAALIFYLSGIPHLKTNLGIWDLILRKCAHIVEYAILTGLLIRAFGRSTDWLFRYVIILSWVVAVFYAGTDEFHQTFVPGRVGCVSDVCIDSIGVTWACLLWAGWHKRWFEAWRSSD